MIPTGVLLPKGNDRFKKSTVWLLLKIGWFTRKNFPIVFATEPKYRWDVRKRVCVKFEVPLIVNSTFTDRLCKTSKGRTIELVMA